MSLDCVWQDSHPDLTALECVSQCLLQPILSRFRASLFQELPKYLRGYHKCSKDEAVQLAGLIYKVRFNNDRTQLAIISKILKELVPDNLLRVISPDEWKKVRTWAFMDYTTCTELYERNQSTLQFQSDSLWKHYGGTLLDVAGLPLRIQILHPLYQRSERYLQSWMTGLKCASLLEILIYFQCPKEELRDRKVSDGTGDLRSLEGKRKVRCVLNFS